MSTQTITEALSEINLVKKKIEKKKTMVIGNLVRPKHTADPFVSQGGAEAALAAEVQAIEDLGRRLIALRAAIGQANLDNEIAIEEEKKTIHDWLIWKREVAKDVAAFYQAVHTQTKQNLDQQARQPQVYKDEEGKTHLLEMVPNLNYPEFIKKAERTGDLLERLDGQLSLKNATITVTV